MKRVSDGEDQGKFRVSVQGFDYYNTKTGNVESGGSNKIAMWMLDPDYDGRSLFPRQVFFPMAGDEDGWAKLARNLKAEIDEELIEAYRGTVSLPFEAGEHGRAAVKIVDDRGIESLKIVDDKVMVQPTKAKAIERLRKVLDAIPELKNLRERDVSPGFEKWRRDTQVAITNTFGKDSRHIGDFNRIDYIRPFMVTDFSNPSDSEDQADYVKGLQSAASVLESMLNEIEEYWEEDEQSSKTSDSRVKMPKSTNKVFVIHGHDESARETVARFLERLELEPVILHEQPNKGRTIIEKFEEHAQVWFAVVLLTPDDVGSACGRQEESKSAGETERDFRIRVLHWQTRSRASLRFGER